MSPLLILSCQRFKGPPSVNRVCFQERGLDIVFVVDLVLSFLHHLFFFFFYLCDDTPHYQSDNVLSRSPFRVHRLSPSAQLELVSNFPFDQHAWPPSHNRLQGQVQPTRPCLHISRTHRSRQMSSPTPRPSLKWCMIHKAALHPFRHSVLFKG